MVQKSHEMRSFNTEAAASTVNPEMLHFKNRIPHFIFAPNMGRKSIEDIETDLFLIPVLAGMKVPKDLHAASAEIADIIKASINENGFSGKQGESLLIEVPLTSFSGKSSYILLAGLGRANNFCAQAAQKVFELFCREALRLEAKRITVPFVPNRGTGSCLTMKGMGHRLKSAVAKVLKDSPQPYSIEEVQIYCTPQARKHIQQGLDIEVDYDHVCNH